MRKTKEEAQKTREQLMQSALDTFLEHGVARTSLAAIARNAGVTRGALYWHFKNKEDLFEALFGQIFSACSASLSDGLKESGGHGLRRMLYDMFERIQSDDTHRKLFTIIHLKCEFTEETRAVFDVQKKYIALWKEQLHALIRRCTERGELPAALARPRRLLPAHRYRRPHQHPPLRTRNRPHCPRPARHRQRGLHPAPQPLPAEAV